MDFIDRLCAVILCISGCRLGCKSVYCTNLVSVHKLLTDDVLTDAGGRHQVVELVEELHAALMMLRCSFAQLVPQDQSHTLGRQKKTSSKIIKFIKRNKAHRQFHSKLE